MVTGCFVHSQYRSDEENQGWGLFSYWLRSKDDHKISQQRSLMNWELSKPIVSHWFLKTRKRTHLKALQNLFSPLLLVIHWNEWWESDFWQRNSMPYITSVLAIRYNYQQYRCYQLPSPNLIKKLKYPTSFIHFCCEVINITVDDRGSGHGLDESLLVQRSLYLTIEPVIDTPATWSNFFLQRPRLWGLRKRAWGQMGGHSKMRRTCGNLLI